MLKKTLTLMNPKTPEPSSTELTELLLIPGGQGKSAYVYTDKELLFAIKKPRDDAPKFQSLFQNEICILKKIPRHENIVELFSASYDEEHFLQKTYLKLGYANQLTLFDELEKLVFRVPDLLWSFHILEGIAKGLSHLHQHHVLHRDIKIENILLHMYPGESLPTAKICDFGLADECKNESVNDREMAAVGTVGYQAPESTRPEREYSKKSDIFSFSIVMLIVATNAFDFLHDCVVDLSSKKSRIQGFTAIGVRPRLPSWLNTDFALMINQSWQHNPKNRPNAEDLARFFSTMKSSIEHLPKTIPIHSQVSTYVLYNR